MKDAYLPKHLRKSESRDWYKKVVNEYADRGDPIEWTTEGPVIRAGNYTVNISSEFMYPPLFPIPKYVKPERFSFIKNLFKRKPK